MSSVSAWPSAVRKGWRCAVGFRMSDDTDDRDDLVGDVADALTLDQQVQWERCARLAAGAERAQIENLRVIERVLASRPVAGQASETMQATRSYGSAVMRRAVQVLIAIATIEVAAALLLLPWAWGDYLREHGEVAVFLTTKFVGHAAGAGLLLWAGRRDWRTWLLGVYCLLMATQAPLLMLQAFVLELPPPQEFSAFLQHLPAANRLFVALYVPAFLFAPAFLWAFARECPRVHRRTRLDDLARRMIPASVVIGSGLWLACAVTLELARAGVAAAPVALVLDGTIATQDLLVLGAVILVALRARTASADEVRRVVVFSAGFLLFMGVSAAYDVAEAFAPGDWISNYRWSPTVLVIEALRFPGLILLWYAVLAVRIPHLREAVRALYRRLLLRPGLLGAVAAVPAGALAWLIGRSPERAVGAVIADPLAQSLFAAVGILLLVIAARERILIRLDAWILPETEDQRQVLADAAGALARAGRITTVGETVTRTVRRGCGSPATLLVADDAETRAGGFSAPQARIVPLSRQTAIVHLLETAGGPVRVEPDGRPSVFPLLPPDEAAWVTETGADVIVPAPGPGTDVLGVLVVGRRLDGRLVRSLDLPFLEALGAAAGLALARLQLLDAPGAGSGEALPAEECPVCRSVTAAGEAPACACGPAPVATEVPKLLAGKFRLTRRLGAGGMGVVYLARDLRLERDVAIKILTESSAVRLVGLKPEAWAMSTVTHPGVAQIHGVEFWRGRPFLIVEFLAGGTLEDRLRDGPLAPSQALSVAARLADALAALHEKGCLHGDVKPRNIGFTTEGSPKLLDFGLARAVDDAAMMGGTLPYLSPEVLSGRPAEEADDVWSLSVVLYEMVAGRHPFAGGTLEEVQRRIRRQRLAAGGPAASAAPTAAASVAAFAASILTAPRAGRPAAATAFAVALAEIPGNA